MTGKESTNRGGTDPETGREAPDRSAGLVGRDQLGAAPLEDVPDVALPVIEPAPPSGHDLPWARRRDEEWVFVIVLAKKDQRWVEQPGNLGNVDPAPVIDHGLVSEEIALPFGRFSVAVSPVLFQTDDPRPQ